MITLTHTTDMNLVRSFMILPEIWDVSVEDGINKDNFYPGCDEFSGWLLCEIDNEVAGLILVHNDNMTTIKVHPYMLKKYRQHGREMMKEFFKWFLESTNCRINKVVVSIPSCRKIVCNFARRIGFKFEGANKASYSYRGQIYDQLCFGLTKDQIKELL